MAARAHVAHHTTHGVLRKVTEGRAHLTRNKMDLTKVLRRIVCRKTVCRKSACSKIRNAKKATLPTHANASTCSAMVCICNHAL